MHMAHSVHSRLQWIPASQRRHLLQWFPERQRMALYALGVVPHAHAGALGFRQEGREGVMDDRWWAGDPQALVVRDRF